MRARRSLADLVLHYRTHYPRHVDRHVEFFAGQSTLAAAVRLAGRAEGPGGKRMNHQRRIPRQALAQCEKRLRGTLRLIELAPDFDALHRVVSDAIGGIRGVGELMLYDTALRIGAYRGLKPKSVYLHAGTRYGARQLGIAAVGAAISMSDLPAELHDLRPADAEDFLCIYKDDFANGAGGRAGWPRRDHCLAKLFDCCS